MENNQIELKPESPMNLIALAIEKGTSIEQLEKLMALKERWDAAQANKTFIAAVSNFQKEVPAIEKKKLVSYQNKSGGGTSYKYAELGEIDEAIKAPMAANGLSKRWEISEDGDKIICTCIISHIDGHKEHTTMSSLKDTTGNKNEIQSRASAVSYLQRYTLIGALGLTTASEDNDGDGTPPVKQQQNNNTDLPWLNITDKSGKLTDFGNDIIAQIKNGKTIADLKTNYKISKATMSILEPVIKDPSKATSFNHQEIVADNKPIIPNEEFKMLCNNIKSGNIYVIEEAMEKYSFVDTQKNIINQLYKQYKK